MKGAVKFVIITGLSGAGKSQAVKVFEDADYFCVDNLPPALLPKFAELCASGGNIQRAALVMDIRGGEFFKALFDALAYLTYHEWPHEVLFLEASEEVLVRRFKETRRRHPLAGVDSIQDGIRREVEMLAEIKKRADKIINTTGLTPSQLKEAVQALFQDGTAGEKLQIRLLSFGFKKGIPLDADFVFDCRFLANPHYVPELKPLTGTDTRVRQFVFGDEVSHYFLAMIHEMVKFVVPHTVKEGRTQLVVAIGCTGGRHRSVAMAEALKEKLVLAHMRVAIEHRHISEEA
ncbi:MAG TPA: RNase adapter RapZ [Clostridiales bacterium UBA8153]|nr:RNase adapter RapZ [Clostridiales bacterium UBA8153]